MIQRFVFFTVKNDQDLYPILQQSKAVLSTIPEVRQVTVGRVVDHEEADGVLMLLFDDMDAVEAFGPHPVHRDYVDNYLKPQITSLRAVNCELV